MTTDSTKQERQPRGAVKAARDGPVPWLPNVDTFLVAPTMMTDVAPKAQALRTIMPMFLFFATLYTNKWLSTFDGGAASVW